jgi:hypothetical protein
MDEPRRLAPAEAWGTLRPAAGVGLVIFFVRAILASTFDPVALDLVNLDALEPVAFALVRLPATVVA